MKGRACQTLPCAAPKRARRGSPGRRRTRLRARPLPGMQRGGRTAAAPAMVPSADPPARRRRPAPPGLAAATPPRSGPRRPPPPPGTGTPREPALPPPSPGTGRREPGPPPRPEPVTAPRVFPAAVRPLRRCSPQDGPERALPPGTGRAPAARLPCPLRGTGHRDAALRGHGRPARVWITQS